MADTGHPEGHPKFFAARVKARRAGVSMAGVRAAGGPAVPTQVKCEAGLLDNPQPKTFDKYDTALGWTEGSAADAYWHAQEPTPLDRPARMPLRTTGPGVEVPLDRVLALMDIQRTLATAADQGKSLAAAEVRDLAARLDQEVNLVVGRWATDMLELNRDHSGVTHAGLVTVLGEALSAPVDPDAPDAEERLYRRWLAGGRHAAGVDEKLRNRFERRYSEGDQQRRGGDDADADR